MIINPQIADLEPHNITTVDPDLSVVEYEARSEAHNFVGRTTGAVVPGSGRADDRNVTVSSDSSPAAGAAQSTDPAGGRVVPPAAAVLISSVSPQPSSGLRPPSPAPAGEGQRQFAATEKPVTDDDIKVATRRQAAVRAFRDLTADVKDQVTGEIITKGMSNRTAARKVGYPFQTIYVWIRAFDAEGFDGLLPKHRNSGRKPTLKFTRQETADVKALLLQTNRTKKAGSTPEALRTAIKRDLLAPETVEVIQHRFGAGQTPLPPAMRQQIYIPETTIEASRGPRNGWLHHVESPGSLHLTMDEETGIEREIEGCERMTMDDGTINMVCNVPFNLPGNKCSENFGVMVGRFQLLLPVEHRYLFIPGFNYTARPRSSYRAEDLTATLQIVFTEHGFPLEIVLEKGISASDLLTETLTMLGIRIIRANSPHQKVVEGVFNRMWTKLSLMPGQVGRYRGEEEEINALIGSCRRGATDPRKHFPMLADVLKALHEAIREHNSQLVISRQYGRWVPAEKWDQFKKNLRRLEPEQSWMFSPVITEPLTVRGFKIRKTVCMMEGYSEVFDFSAEWLHEFSGQTVKLYFNPFAGECIATVVLAQSFNGRKAGEILGQAEQINRMTRFRRRALGYGEDPDIGREAASRNAQALRRSVVAIRSDGSAGVQKHEARNGVGDSEVVTNDARLVQPAPAATPRHNILAPQTPAQMARQQDRFARLAARQRELGAE